MRTRAKRGGWVQLAQQIQFLPKWVLESAVLKQYLMRWKLLVA